MNRRVFVVQDSFDRTFDAAESWGDLNYLVPPDVQLIGEPNPGLMQMLEKELGSYRDGDSILATGDPALIGIAVAIAARANEGRVRVLKWDRIQRGYYAVTFVLRGYGSNALKPNRLRA